MDEFDDWPISDEEITRLNIHVNDHSWERCATCIDIRQRRIHAHLDRFEELCQTWRCGHDLDMLVKAVIKETTKDLTEDLY